MAALTRLLAAALLLVEGAGCSELVGLEGQPEPFARLKVVLTGELTASDYPDGGYFWVKLHWGGAWRPDPFCLLPPESEAAAAVINAGCSDSFRFVPGHARNILGYNAAAESGVDPASRTATLELPRLPLVDEMVGDVTGRIAYGSVFVVGSNRGDWVHYGASFLTMTRPDQRLAFREGDFDSGSVFYPRRGCPPPPPGLSVLSTGGVSRQAALQAASTGTAPEQDPSTCRAERPEQAVIAIALEPPRPFVPIVCGTTGQVIHYPAPDQAPKTSEHWACASLPGSTGRVQLVVAVEAESVADCPGLNHYLLRGCWSDPACAAPDWDFTATPPAWWPCEVPR